MRIALLLGWLKKEKKKEKIFLKVRKIIDKTSAWKFAEIWNGNLAEMFWKCFLKGFLGF